MRVAIGLVALIVVGASDARAAPCFPGKRTAKFDGALWNLQGWFDDDGKRQGPRGRWGTCTVDRGMLREADGTLVAQVHSGMRLTAAGIVNDHGAGVGMSGEQVLEAYGDGPSSTLVCASTFEPKVRRAQCWFPTGQFGEWDWSYIVVGRLPESNAERGWLVRGEKALAFFRTRRVIAIQHRGSNH